MMQTARKAAGRLLDGMTVLLVEDEAIIALMVEDMLQELGAASVHRAGKVEPALRLLAERRPDVAVLDVNLGGEYAFPVAERLQATGVPFVFATGYGRKGIPDALSAQRVIQKPFPLGTLEQALYGALTDGAG